MTGLVAVARLNHGRWIADCPRPYCGNAEQFGNDSKGNPGGLTGSFRCRTEEGGCGLICAAQWPTNVEDIEAMVLCRPVPATRNWQPGEDLHDLLAENLAHGIAPLRPADLEGPGGLLLAISGDQMSGPAIDRSSGRPQLPQGR